MTICLHKVIWFWTWALRSIVSELLCWFNWFIFGLVINYEVSVVTGDVRAAGTNAKVFMQIYGETGKTELIILENRSNNFERGATDIFKVWWIQPILLPRWERNDQPTFRYQKNDRPSHQENRPQQIGQLCLPLLTFTHLFEGFCVSWSEFFILRSW